MSKKLLVGALTLLGSAQPKAPPRAPELWREVEIVRTAHGVPHIRAENLRAAGYALAWLQLEDYGPRTALNVLRARGEMGRVFGRDSMSSDFTWRRARRRAIDSYHRLDQPTRDVYDGFALGVDRYIELHPGEFPAEMPRDFSGYDVATLDVGRPPSNPPRAFLARLGVTDTTRGDAPEPRDPDVGSNAWALAPSRTKSKKAILLRNPHLVWTSGYYEAHMIVPGVVDFYGDFRIGGPFAVVGGFNKDLGWATTNNSQDIDELYALDADTARADHYWLDGASLPLDRETVAVEYRDGDSLAVEARDFWSSAVGPVVYRDASRIYVVKSAIDGEFRGGEQFLRMMRATDLAEWKDAMRMRARPTSNFTYADRAGNIFYFWNGSIPKLPHPSGGDSIATPAHETRDVWTELVPFDSLPQLLNPKGGYIHNENDSPHYTNVSGPIDTVNAYPNLEKPELSLRSQLAIQLIGGRDKLSLEDVVARKHSYRMLLADRVKPDLIAAVAATKPAGDTAAALDLLRLWNNTAAPDSRGAMLFETWWQHYAARFPDSSRYAQPWTSADPLRTPRGLADPKRAADAFGWAVAETARRLGRWDVAWGDVHRVRRGPVDVPVGGCSGALGCFRVLTFRQDSDGKLAANGSDGWILAVEFGDTPRAYSVLAYGESSREESPWFSDQAAMFARGELKKVAFTPRDVDASAVVKYRPGAPESGNQGAPPARTSPVWLALQYPSIGPSWTAVGWPSRCSARRSQCCMPARQPHRLVLAGNH
jgi:acyl-homoserine-lactone acylase